MSISGKYVYCIIKASQDFRFGPIGLQGEEVLTIGIDDMAMVVSHYESDEVGQIRSSRKNLLTHQKVLEKIMEEHTVLPVKFGTMAAHEGEIHNLLLRHYKGFEHNLQKFDNKVELGLKVFWKDMKGIYDEVLQENEPIQKLKIQLSNQENTNGLIEIGQMVEAAVAEKKENEGQFFLDELTPIAIEHTTANLLGDQMCLNASFLVSKGREKEFDNTVEELAEKMEERYTFKYVGPLAPYNFVELGIYPEEWETD